jgi:jumonji domain-containing protein 2
MAKVTLPTGFWPTEPKSWTAGDRTGRGPAWQSGTPLGDYVISTPIAQHVRGLAGVYEYSFVDKPSMTLAEFRIKADQYRQELVGCPYDVFVPKDNQDQPDTDRSTTAATFVNQEQQTQQQEQNDYTNDKTSGPINKASNKSKNVFTNEEERLHYLERYFWKRLGPTMPPAWYGADHEGTLFPDDDDASGWSVGQLDSCLHVLPHVPGVTTPYLYLGMWASVFCAHTEDMNLLSINYLHAGAPKLWYAIAPGPDAKRFESLCMSCFVGTPSTKNCPEFLRHKRSLLSPKVLQKAGIKYTTAIQRPGDAMITFPAGYHFGFNTGFNIAEATNFGVPEWIPYGLQARVCLCRPDSVRIDMNRLAKYLAEFDRDQSRYRRKRLSWKEWSAKKHSKNNNVNEQPVQEGGTSQLDKDKTALSEQEKKGEFWIEVAKPITKKAKKSKERVSSSKKEKHVESEETADAEEPTGRGRRKRKLTAKAARWEREQQRKKAALESPQPEKKSKSSSSSTAAATVAEEIWHLAKPLPKKLVKVGVRVLVLLPGTTMGHDPRRKKQDERDGTALTDDDDDDDDSEDYYSYSAKLSKTQKKLRSMIDDNDDSDEEEELCFVGQIAEVSDGDYVRIHMDGLPRTEDVWMNLNDDKVFLNGGRWDEDTGEDVDEEDAVKTGRALPQLHYWDVMDSKHRLG